MAIDLELRIGDATGLQTMDRQLRVFLSYTAEDLHAHAEAVGAIARQCDWIPIDHRYWAASGRPSVQECKEHIRRCDVLFVLVAHRYGYVPTQEEGGDGERSITWIEVDYARSQGLQIIPFLLKDTAVWPIRLVEGMGDVLTFQRLQRFKSELRRFHCAPFTETPDSLAGPAAVALQKAAQSVASQRSEPAAITRLHNQTSIVNSRDIERRGFERLLCENLALGEGSDLVVVCDETLEPLMSSLNAAIIGHRLAATLVYIPMNQQLAMVDDTGASEISTRLPVGLKAAFETAQGILTCLSGDTTTAAVRRALLRLPRSRASRLVHIPSPTRQLLEIMAASDTDDLTNETRALAERITQSRQIDVLTMGERDVVHRLRIIRPPGSPGVIVNNGVPAPGGWSNVPGGSVSVIPMASDVSGTVLIDGSAPGIVLSRPQGFELTFADGRLVAESGLHVALNGFFAQSASLAARVGDANWNVCAELSIGLNPGVPGMSGMMLADTKRRGVVSVAIGDNATMGGHNLSSIHMDFATLAPTVVVDGVEIVRSGRVVAT